MITVRLSMLDDRPSRPWSIDVETPFGPTQVLFDEFAQIEEFSKRLQSVLSVYHRMIDW